MERRSVATTYITPDPETSCGEDREPCLTLDQFASENSNGSVTLILIPGHHNLTRNIEKLVLIISLFLLMAVSQSNVHHLLPSSLKTSLILKYKTAIVSCGGGGSSSALQVRSVHKFRISKVTLQESASVSLSVQDCNGLVTGARFIGNTGAGNNITNSTIII